MKITINGEEKILNHQPTSLENLLTSLKYNPKLIVIEFNGKILPSTSWKDQTIKDEDSIEIVSIVGGGNYIIS